MTIDTIPTEQDKELRKKISKMCEGIAAGYRYSRAGENLASKYDDTKGAFDGLLNSPTHHANIVGDYKDIGVGFSECGGMNYYVIHYGKK